MSTIFSSLDTARRALSAQQAAIQTTGNNISNASTPGYSRQRVDLQASTPFPSVGMNQPAIPGQEGTGVEAAAVTRVRDTFVDQQVRQQTTSNGYWAAKSDSLSQMEGIMNEPSDSGLSKVMNDFWSSWQDLADDPSNSGAQSVVVQDGQTVASTFQYLSNSLNQVKNNIGTNIGVTADQINSIASQINDLNKQISSVEPSGLTANDLYDRRDQLVDQLSQYVNVQVSTTPSGGRPAAGAAGLYTIQIKTLDPSSGQPTLTTLVDGKNLKTNKLNVDLGSDSKPPSVTVGGTTISAGGKLQGLMDTYSQDFPQMLNQLNTMASTLSSSINDKITAYNTTNNTNLPTFFTISGTDAASSIDVNTTLKNDHSQVPAGQLVSDSNGSDQIPISLSIANGLSTQAYSFDGSANPTTFQGFYQMAIGQMGVNAQAANRMSTNTQTLLDAATQRRDSVSGVSIDEEMTNLIQYQHAYSAAARMVTTINQMMDTLVNLGQ